MYYFDVNQNLERLIKKDIRILSELKIPISDSVYFKEGTGLSLYGSCSQYKNGSQKGYDFTVSISKFLVNENEIEETIIHELLHTIENCCPNHNTKWKYYAEMCSKETGLKIEVMGNKIIDSKELLKRQKVFQLHDYNNETMKIVICPRCRKQVCVSNDVKKLSNNACKYICNKCRKPYYYEMPQSDFKDLNDEQRHMKLDYLLHNNIKFLLDHIDSIFAYLSQDDCDYTWLYLRVNQPDLFTDLKTDRLKQIIERYISKEAKHKLAEKILNGDFDYIMFNYKQWVFFTNVLCLTKDYILTEEYYKKNKDCFK